MLLELSNVEVIYSDVILVLKGINMAVPEGSIVALLGANGAGKTTTLKAISGLLHAEDGAVTSGSINFQEKTIHKEEPQNIVHMGLVQVMEGRRVLEHMTVEQNLIVGGNRHKSRQDLKKALDKVYTYFPKLGEMRNLVSGYLSGGEQQMMVIGRALMAKPKLILLDEPSLGLAPKIKDKIFLAINKIKREGTTTLLVEQDAVLAMNVGENIHLLEEGKIEMRGTKEELEKEPRIKKVYLGI